MNRERSLELCRLIAGLVVSDDDLDAGEEAFIDRVLATFGIPVTERESLLPIVDRAEAAEAVRRLPPDVQATALDLLVEATVADGKVAPEERAYLDAVAAEMQVPPKELEARIASKLAERR
jgi:uncharacterized tellurite resistance protein B-like protein